MKVAVGCDHGGFELKEGLKPYLGSKGIEVCDMGTHCDESVDYPEYANAVATEVLKSDVDFGILICGTGIGIGIAANKIKGIRCAVVHDEFTARMCKQHNDANIISMGGRVIDLDMAKKIVDVYLQTEFEGGRHQRRVDKIMKLES